MNRRETSRFIVMARSVKTGPEILLPRLRDQNDIAGLFCLPRNIHQYPSQRVAAEINVATALPR